MPTLNYALSRSTLSPSGTEARAQFFAQYGVPPERLELAFGLTYTEIVACGLPLTEAGETYVGGYSDQTVALDKALSQVYRETGGKATQDQYQHAAVDALIAVEEARVEKERAEKAQQARDAEAKRVRLQQIEEGVRAALARGETFAETKYGDGGRSESTGEVSYRALPEDLAHQLREACQRTKEREQAEAEQKETIVRAIETTILRSMGLEALATQHSEGLAGDEAKRTILDKLLPGIPAAERIEEGDCTCCEITVVSDRPALTPSEYEDLQDLRATAKELCVPASEELHLPAIDAQVSAVKLVTCECPNGADCEDGADGARVASALVRIVCGPASWSRRVALS